MEVKDDLLKEAIADARAVRETALENAKIALEEAFNPHVKAMLAKQIQSEIDEDDDFEDEEEMDYEDEEGGEEDIAVEPEEGEDEFAGDDEEEIEFDEGEEDLEDDEGAFDGAADEFEAEDDEDEEEEDELDLEATIKELEADLEDDDEEEIDFEESEDLDEEDDEELDFDVDDDEEDEEIDENDVSSDIGKSDNKQPGKANQSSGIGTVGKAKLKEDEEIDEDDDVDLQELINQLIGEDDDYEDDEEADEEDAEMELENVQLKADLEEHIKVIKFLRSKINEVNLLNSKLLYTNKLFRSFELDNEKKYKVVETFDRAKNLREVKLIFSTIAESFGAKAVKKEKIVETKKVRKPQSGSSKAVKSTKPETDILEENVDLRARYQKLANIKTK